LVVAGRRLVLAAAPAVFGFLDTADFFVVADEPAERRRTGSAVRCLKPQVQAFAFILLFAKTNTR
jgi:hypothetical protein